jgi:hypothetical protein
VHVPDRGAEGLRPDEDACCYVAEDEGQPECSGRNPPKEGSDQDESYVAGYSHDSAYTLLRSPKRPTERTGCPVPMSAWKGDSPKFDVLWLAAVVGLDIMNVRRPLGRGSGQVKHGMRRGKSRNLPTTTGRLA